MGKLTLNWLRALTLVSGCCSLVFGFILNKEQILPAIFGHMAITIIIAMIIVFVLSFFLMTWGQGIHYDPKAK